MLWFEGILSITFFKAFQSYCTLSKSHLWKVFKKFMKNEKNCMDFKIALHKLNSSLNSIYPEAFWRSPVLHPTWQCAYLQRFQALPFPSLAISNCSDLKSFLLCWRYALKSSAQESSVTRMHRFYIKFLSDFGYSVLHVFNLKVFSYALTFG